jgi:DNA repair protein RecO (recombination protein O)
MTEITKSEAILLKKTKYGDSSLILQLYSKDLGRISAIVKGARSSKSKIGSKIDLINQVEVVLYNKDEKDLQLITQVNLINHFPKIKEELDKLKYASAVCELILKLTPDHDVNDKIYRGSVRILNLINDSKNSEAFLFARYLLFFIKEIGFEISLDHCSNCGVKFGKHSGNAFNYGSGIICENCNEDKMISFQLSEELFNLLKCLTIKNDKISYNKKDVEIIISILEKFLVYHNSDFKAIKSLQIL